ncbi:MAG: C69 family dipeptidase, partial [Bacteroidales bacterium]|nr:C69 family dipeptidase [Bacteroidales bacterium]
MKRIALLNLLAVMVISLVAQEDFSKFNCSTIIVGKDASKTGSVLIGHNEDDGGTQFINYLKADPKDHDKNSLMGLRNGAEIKQIG